jgi:hypothetical protein
MPALSSSVFAMLRSCLLLVAAMSSATLSAQSAQLNRIGGYTSGLGSGSVEIVAYDATTRRAFTVNGGGSSFDIVDLSNVAAPTLFQRVSIANGSPNSVAVAGGIVAVAIQDTVPQNPGRVGFFTTAGLPLGSVTVGALPDMVSFTPDGRFVLTANEGEPNATYTVDPEGSVSIIDLAQGVGAATVRTVRFVDFNVGGPRAGEIPAALRIFGPGASVAQDLEPEYIAVTPDSRTAFVSLQENNGMAVIDVVAGTVTRLFALGFKSHNLAANAFDPSDRDGPSNGQAISIRNFPVFGMYQPDSIAVLPNAAGQPIVFTANEGDARDYPPAFSEEVRVGAAGYVLDPTVFPNAADLKLNANLGRLTVTNRLGDTDNDGDFDAIYAFGARSMSAFNGQTGALVFDSAGDFESVTSTLHPTLFNSEGATATFDTRSDNKGPEPEALVIGDVGGRRYAFAGMERIGGAFIYDVTNPMQPQRLGYSLSQGGDFSPEGFAYVPPAESPNQRALLLAAHEVSGTLGVYEVQTCTVSSITLTAPVQIGVVGYCPTGLDLRCRRGAQTTLVASGLVVNTATQATASAPFQPGDTCFASLPGQSIPLNGVEAGFNLQAQAVDGLDDAAQLTLMLLLLGLGLVALRLVPRAD